MSKAQPSALVADIGGTHARFAVVAGNQVLDPVVLRCADYEGPAAAARSYLAANFPDRRPVRAAFAPGTARATIPTQAGPFRARQSP